VLILNLNASGHHPIYLRWILESGLSRVAELIVASRTELFEHPELAALSTQFTRQEITIDGSIARRMTDFSTFGLIKMSWTIGRLYRDAFSRVSRIAPVDFVIVPFIDDCLMGLAAPRDSFAGVPWMAITMRTMFHYDQIGVIAPRQRFASLRRRLFYRILKQKSLISLLAIDPTLAAFAAGQVDLWMHKIKFLPDPARCHADLPPRAAAKAQLGIPRDVRLVVLYGEIALRKGVLCLLDAAADAACPAAVHVLLAGRSQERDFIENTPAFRRLAAEGRVHTIIGYLNSDQERLVLAAADCMWVGYIDFYGMSGIMVLAGRHAIPLIASREGLIGYLVSRYGIGEVVEPRNRSSVVDALRKLADDPESFERAGEKGVPLFEGHDPLEYQRLVAETAESSWDE
jgi:glycosyltransferase involved in cell wall biosynthesis